MDKIRVAILEDEFLISRDIAANLEELGYTISGIYETGSQAIEGIKSERPDIILMDINIEGEIDGIETAEIIRKSHDLPIIYITAYSDQTTINRAKKTLPHAFIVKPFNFKNLNTTVEFALFNYTNRRSTTIEESKQISTMNEVDFVGDKTIFIKEKGRLVKVEIENICYLAAKGSYCEIFTLKKKFTVSRNLNTILDRLQSENILRVHRSYAINLNQLEEILEGEVSINGQKIPLSKSARTELLSKVNAI